MSTPLVRVVMKNTTSLITILWQFFNLEDKRCRPRRYSVNSTVFISLTVIFTGHAFLSQKKTFRKYLKGNHINSDSQGKHRTVLSVETKVKLPERVTGPRKCTRQRANYSRSGKRFIGVGKERGCDGYGSRTEGFMKAVGRGASSGRPVWVGWARTVTIVTVTLCNLDVVLLHRGITPKP